MTFAFGDIVLVDCDPAVGHELKKKRPAIVVQEERVSRVSPYVTVMLMSSKLHNMGEEDIFVSKDRKNGLQKDSVIRARQIMSYDLSRFKFYIGTAESPVVRKVRGYLRRHFGL